jgi:hypothetical protein
MLGPNIFQAGGLSTVPLIRQMYLKLLELGMILLCGNPFDTTTYTMQAREFVRKLDKT